ncbi:heavy-metal-associated domain-containing protein [Flavobacterium wongokense]|uniref:heavy-metal-associated domain-containing protein n=1 Tax=Flavobacterium wongokense TaxID=2910674 RepID=UPI001F1F1CAD|nr:heavy-metal-associated domain-containing protein [Flavobacterium sp. WG47]MCF6132765.1 heavy-metal-associated domain-containing protein [Flavobacterium sp. WG47]
MKIINNLYTLVATLLLLTGLDANAQISKAEIRATGLTCSMCSNAINKQLKSLPEVVEVATDLNTNTFVVTLTPGNTLSPKVFKDKVEKAGFFIGSLVLTTKSDTVKQPAYVLVNKASAGDADIQIQVLDKGYVTEKEFKKLSKSFKNVETYAVSNEDDFHIKVLNQ